MRASFSRKGCVMISMKNNKIKASWDKIEPSDSEKRRMLTAILERNHSAQKGKVIGNNMRIVMRSEKAIALLAACFTVFAVVAAMAGLLVWRNNTKSELYIYKSDKVEVTLLKDTGEIKPVDYEWAPVTDDIAYTKNNLIIVGEAANIRSAVIKYHYMDTDVSDQITIFDVKIQDVLSCSPDFVHSGDMITVGIGYNMNNYGEGLPIIEDGRSYMIFCYTVSENTNDVLELANYVDCWISAPKDLFVEKVGDYYLSIDYFSDTPGSLAVSGATHLTREQFTALFSEDRKDADSADPASIPLAPYVLTALQILYDRSLQQPEACWNLCDRAFLCPCSVLEDYVRNKALTYK